MYYEMVGPGFRERAIEAECDETDTLLWVADYLARISRNSPHLVKEIR